jgi:hypothetical protein
VFLNRRACGAARRALDSEPARTRFPTADIIEL